MSRLSDELLRQIAQSNNKPYAHEGRAMAQEILERRNDEKLAQMAKATAGSPSLGGPWGLGSAPLPPPGKP